SLLLLKSSGTVAHGGGKRIEPGSDEYKTLRRWVASGLPFGRPDDPVVTRISLFPERRVLPRNSRQQFAVYAHYSDGTAEDITRTLPTPKQVAEFVNDPGADRRDRLVDRLLEAPEYAYYFASKWADVLRVKRGNQPNRAYGTFLFHDWIRQAMADDRPYDEFAREILAAVGDETKSPPTVWYKDLQTADLFVDNASQVFL